MIRETATAAASPNEQNELAQISDRILHIFKRGVYHTTEISTTSHLRARDNEISQTHANDPNSYHPRVLVVYGLSLAANSEGSNFTKAVPFDGDIRPTYPETSGDDADDDGSELSEDSLLSIIAVRGPKIIPESNQEHLTCKRRKDAQIDNSSSHTIIKRQKRKGQVAHFRVTNVTFLLLLLPLLTMADSSHGDNPVGQSLRNTKAFIEAVRSKTRSGKFAKSCNDRVYNHDDPSRGQKRADDRSLDGDLRSTILELIKAIEELVTMQRAYTEGDEKDLAGVEQKFEIRQRGPGTFEQTIQSQRITSAQTEEQYTFSAKFDVTLSLNQEAYLKPTAQIIAPTSSYKGEARAGEGAPKHRGQLAETHRCLETNGFLDGEIIDEGIGALKFPELRSIGKRENEAADSKPTETLEAKRDTSRTTSNLPQGPYVIGDSAVSRIAEPVMSHTLLETEAGTRKSKRIRDQLDNEFKKRRTAQIRLLNPSVEKGKRNERKETQFDPKMRLCGLDNS
ncbi:hypothetical protein Dda_7090 [Drechslerella dactyloides]|uniref:Uncharacterized protein n=1 Tax=Drechslerella dactyloides TaxID=74499 RepID=A0AAD6NHB6_DREDA|nr:hypothetical protein Dda_7090 [Drechslerella dactyloides]